VKNLNEEMDKKQKILHAIYENPRKVGYKPTSSEKLIVEKLREWMQKKESYNGKIICGEHGVGKTFAIRYFLSQMGLLDEAYVHLNNLVLQELKKRNILPTMKRQINKELREVVEKVKAKKPYPILAFDSCEVLMLLDSSDRNRFFRDVHYSKEKIVVVVPTELDPQIPSITIRMPSLSKEDCKIVVENLGTWHSEEWYDNLPLNCPLTYIIKEA